MNKPTYFVLFSVVLALASSTILPVYEPKCGANQIWTKERGCI